jgi:hypothetical protein
MRSAKDFFRPLALGAPMPLREIPFKPSRMIHFFDPSNAKMAAKVPDIAKKATSCSATSRTRSRRTTRSRRAKDS